MTGASRPDSAFTQNGRTVAIVGGFLGDGARHPPLRQAHERALRVVLVEPREEPGAGSIHADAGDYLPRRVYDAYLRAGGGAGAATRAADGAHEDRGAERELSGSPPKPAP